MLLRSNCERGYVSAWRRVASGVFHKGRAIPVLLRQDSASVLIQDAMYADDMALVAESRSEMQHMVKVLDKAREHTKVRAFRTVVMPVLLFGTETWPVTQKDI